MSDDSSRIELVPATEESLEAALGGRGSLAHALQAQVPGDWPPTQYTARLVNRSLEIVRRGGAAAAFHLHFLVVDGHAHSPRTVAGVAGFNGPPLPDGTLEIGYAIVDSMQRQGLARQAVGLLVERARALPGVRCVIAYALRDVESSLHVLERNGFVQTGAGPDPGVLRFALELA
ncbi:MAG: GNAT family N-acetyltransferase [Planctomycetes bacterium]|nr:GNAT family N-acetyltransferase [Planctomycetota bacterium]